MKKIESLTPEQEARLVSYRNEWLAIGRSTEPADRVASERAFVRMYAWLGKPAPKVMWFDGPATGSIARTILRDNLRDNLWDNLGANLWANLWGNLWGNLGDNLWDNLGANLWDNLWDNLNWGFWGSHESHWPAYYNFADEVLRKMFSESDREKLNAWITLSKSCGWWHPYENFVFACERPERQLIDEQGRLHCTDGPALLCRDGWPVHAVHGVRVPAYVVEQKELITIDKIDAEENAEVRCIMMGFFGFERFIKEGGGIKLHSDDYGDLYRREIPNDEPLVMVSVLNSTPEPDGEFKRYTLRVPPSITTARQAVAWTFGMEEKEYAPAIET